jgi:hypothetical protein
VLALISFEYSAGYQYLNGGNDDLTENNKEGCQADEETAQGSKGSPVRYKDAFSS